MIAKRLRTRKEIDGLLDYFRELLETDVTVDLVRHALEVKEEYGIQYYDALIVSAAEKLGCHEIVTEDLNPNQLYRGMAIVNPFAED
jgi:predicted nucleic acid-binding protein